MHIRVLPDLKYVTLVLTKDEAYAYNGMTVSRIEKFLRSVAGQFVGDIADHGMLYFGKNGECIAQWMDAGDDNFTISCMKDGCWMVERSYKKWPRINLRPLLERGEEGHE